MVNVLLFIFIFLWVYTLFSSLMSQTKVEKNECKLHKWSRNEITGELECLECKQVATRYRVKRLDEL